MASIARLPSSTDDSSCLAREIGAFGPADRDRHACNEMRHRSRVVPPRVYGHMCMHIHMHMHVHAILGTP